jgi:hypothetical protein
LEAWTSCFPYNLVRWCNSINGQLDDSASVVGRCQFGFEFDLSDVILGKALEELNMGTGTILALETLQ